jgi:hypothetical protein
MGTVWLDRSRLGDGPPQLLKKNLEFLLSHLLYYSNHWKLLNFPNSFGDIELTHYIILFWILFPFFRWVNTFSRFALNLFENRQPASCRFSSEFHADMSSVSTNRKSGKCNCCRQKSLANSKGFVWSSLLIQCNNKGQVIYKYRYI